MKKLDAGHYMMPLLREEGLTLHARYGVERPFHEQRRVADVVVLGLDDFEHLSLKLGLHLPEPGLRRVQQADRRVQDQPAAQRVERVHRVPHVDVLHGGLSHGRVDLWHDGQYV